MASSRARGPLVALVRRVRTVLVPERESLVAGIDELHRRLEVLEKDRVELHETTRTHLAQAQQERLRLHERLERLEIESLRARERFAAGDVDPAALVARMAEVEDGLHEARRLNIRIAELTDIVTELVLPLHDREIDAGRLRPAGTEPL